MTQVPPDPLESPVWEAMVENYLKDRPVVFDQAVQIGLPPVTEDQTQVPISVDARKLGQVEMIHVIGDLSPFPLALTVRPQKTPAYFAFRQRIEQGTAIRAAALKNGTWHVGAAYLDAAGGGCSSPPVTEAKVDWDRLGQMRGKIWREDENTLRVRLRIMHPMDTGLHKEPAFFIQGIQFRDAKGNMLNDIEVKEPIEANPTFTFLMADPKGGDHIQISAQDNDGHKFEAKAPLLRTAAMTKVIREGRL